jgi:hypothetical protein
MQSNILTISCTALHLNTPPGCTPPVRRNEDPKGPAAASPGPGPESPKGR